MSKRLSSKEKISRRLGVNMWGRPKSPYNKREYGPGQHGQSRRRKLSDFGVQLQAKQKLKGYYGNIGERQFRRYYDDAVRRRGDTGQNLIELLERRLDATVYRMKFVPTVFAARQFINHGHILVNGKKVNVPSYMVKDGDIVEIKEKVPRAAAGSGRAGTGRARRAGISDGRFRKDARPVRPRPRPRRCALCGADGAEPGDRILFPVARLPVAGAKGGLRAAFFVSGAGRRSIFGHFVIRSDQTGDGAELFDRQGFGPGRRIDIEPAKRLGRLGE